MLKTILMQSSFFSTESLSLFIFPSFPHHRKEKRRKTGVRWSNKRQREAVFIIDSLRLTSHKQKFTAKRNSEPNHNCRKESRVMTANDCRIVIGRAVPFRCKFPLMGRQSESSWHMIVTNRREGVVCCVWEKFAHSREIKIINRDNGVVVIIFARSYSADIILQNI